MRYFYIFNVFEGTTRMYSVGEGAVADPEAQLDTGESYVEVSRLLDLDTEYASVDGDIYDKIPFPVEDFYSVAVDNTVSIEVPAGTFVTWPDFVRDRVDDNLVEYETDIPSLSKIRLDNIKFITKEVEIEAFIQI